MEESDDRPSPFHDGEKAVQARVGVRDQIERVGHAMIRDAMPLQHRQFFSRQQLLFIGHSDAGGRLWASVLAGEIGFAHATDARTLRIDAKAAPGDPLAGAIAPGLSVGLLGIDLSTRRRNRMNGVVSAADESGFAVGVEQSFGNCPQYIQARTYEWVGEPAALSRAANVAIGPKLDELARGIVRRADTLFLASAARLPAGPAKTGAAHETGSGADISHRGGKPGFVRVTENDAGASVLTIPDFTGNFLFNTLGNLAANPRAGILVVDFDSGDLLQLTGRADIVWDGDELAAFEGAQRLVRIVVEEGRLHTAALPLRWSAPDFARQLEDTGSWPETGA